MNHTQLRAGARVALVVGTAAVAAVGGAAIASAKISGGGTLTANGNTVTLGVDVTGKGNISCTADVLAAGIVVKKETLAGGPDVLKTTRTFAGIPAGTYTVKPTCTDDDGPAKLADMSVTVSSTANVAAATDAVQETTKVGQTATSVAATTAHATNTVGTALSGAAATHADTSSPTGILQMIVSLLSGLLGGS
ncbi:hypothetical protein [Smaragdicoccus niigatensis]|uniref:hypothetical protein n=1 Tax=Smaragdicoccus niigatensis TaxID=359359 RepID=UPI00039D9EF2|nr:hypothetical protein [Smaragdicoccus niigatensis]